MTRIKEEKKITIEALVDITCDVCGKSCKTENRFFDYSEIFIPSRRINH